MLSHIQNLPLSIKVACPFMGFCHNNLRVPGLEAGGGGMPGHEHLVLAMLQIASSGP